jgi:membrane-associated protein
MEFAQFVLDFVFHIDRHLQHFVQAYGGWVYALLFLVIFIETGLVVMPFLPGDSLLFVIGTLCGVGVMNLPVSIVVLTAAAILGNQCNYTIGRWVGPRVFGWEQSRWFNRRAFDQAHAFYEERGGITLVLGRFMPFVRTFAPFVAGVAQMTRARFTFFDVTGGAAWVCSVVLLGYLFGNAPFVQHHLSEIFWAMIIIPAALIVLGAVRSQLGRAKPGPTSP